MPSIPDVMAHDLGRWRHRIVTVEDGTVVLAISIGSRPARQIAAMGYDGRSVGAGHELRGAPADWTWPSQTAYGRI
jgi:hypothetical protein